MSGNIEDEKGNLPPVTRKFVNLPRKGEDVSLFPDGTTDKVDRVEYNFDGSVSLVFKILDRDYDIYKEEIELYPSNLHLLI